MSHENPAIKPATSFLHLYATHAVASDGDKIINVPLTSEQIVQLAADATELAAKILRWEKRDVMQPGKTGPDADSGAVRPARGR